MVINGNAGGAYFMIIAVGAILSCQKSMVINGNAGGAHL